MKTLHVIIALSALSTASQAALTANLIAYYDFAETGTAGLANKAPGATGFHGAWSNSGAFTGGSGPGFTGDAEFVTGDGLSNRSPLLVGNALNVVDTTQEYMIAPIGSTNLGTTFTISAWTYLAPGASNSSPRYHAFESGDQFIYDVSWGTSATYSTDGNYLGYVETTASAPITGLAEETWQHVVMVYNVPTAGDKTVSIYMNGSTTTPVVATDTSGTFAFTSLHIGSERSFSGTDRDWDGMIDEFAIWNRALTTDEISEVYQLGLAGMAVPEPSSFALLGTFGLLALLRRRVR